MKVRNMVRGGAIVAVSLGLSSLGTGMGLTSASGGAATNRSEPAQSGSSISPDGCGSASSHGVVSGSASRVGISSGTYTEWVQPGATVVLSGTKSGTSDWSVSANIGVTLSMAIASASATVGGTYGGSGTNSVTSSVSYKVPNDGYGYGRIMVYIEGARYEEYHQVLNLSCTVSTSYPWVNVPEEHPEALWGLQRQSGPNSGVTTPW
jgi:hypothetical protein